MGDGTGLGESKLIELSGSCLFPLAENGDEGIIELMSPKEGSLPRGEVGALLFPKGTVVASLVFKLSPGTLEIDVSVSAVGLVPVVPVSVVVVVVGVAVVVVVGLVNVVLVASVGLVSVVDALPRSTVLLLDLGDLAALFFIDWNEEGVNFPFS